MTPLLLLLLCLLPLVDAAGAGTVSGDFAALLAAKSALSDPAAALSAWDPVVSPFPCRWPHILCSNRSGAPAVAALLLSNLSLAGEFPTPLCSLRSLARLDLSYNSLSGPLPACLAALPSLRHLDLAGNAFSGAVPASYGAGFPSLATLDLSGNELSGAFPGFLLTNVTTLEESLLAYNPFAPSPLLPPASSSFSVRLRVLWLAGCGLVGAIPPSVGRLVWGLPRLYLLELAGNALSGEVAPAVAAAKNLSQLIISENRFTGALPPELGSLPCLFELSAAGNGFSGPFPASLAEVATLGRLDLSNNSLSGELPRGVRKWQKLTQLDLAGNRLTGTIPPELGELLVLNSLDLSSNELTGDVPAQLENLKLSQLNLSNNRLTGALPPLFAGAMYADSFLGNPALCRGGVTCANGGGASGAAGRRGLVGSVASILAVAGVVFVLGVAWFCYEYRSQRQREQRAAAAAGGGDGRPRWALTSFHKGEFDGDDILACLDEDNVVGAGAAGKVYRAVLRHGGEIVAVKKLWGGKAVASADAGAAKDTFDAEVATLGRVRHKNIVKLWCCFRGGDDCRLLVYEYMANGSLGDLLHGGGHGGKGGAVFLDWPARHRIMVDAAEGLAYLHHDCAPPIVHRDVKSNNILLDADLAAKVADFGVARVVAAGDAMTAIAGSCGYIAPEYSYTLRVTERSDVYSFGVVMLELVTGKRPVGPELGEKDLVRWVCGAIERDGGVDAVLDPRLAGASRDDMVRVLHVALLCTSSLPINRPSMRAVVKLLLEAAPLPPSPPLPERKSTAAAEEEPALDV